MDRENIGFIRCHADDVTFAHVLFYWEKLNSMINIGQWPGDFQGLGGGIVSKK